MSLPRTNSRDGIHHSSPTLSNGIPVAPRTRPTAIYQQDPPLVSAQQQQQQHPVTSPLRPAASSTDVPSSPDRASVLRPASPVSKHFSASGSSSEPLVINIDAPIQTPTRGAVSPAAVSTGSGNRVVTRHTATSSSGISIRNVPLGQVSHSNVVNVPAAVPYFSAVPFSTPSRSSSQQLGDSIGSYQPGDAATAAPYQPHPVMATHAQRGAQRVASPTSPMSGGRAHQEMDILRKMLSERETELAIRSEQFRSEQREWADVLRLNQDELLLARRTVESLTAELHECQSREQHSIAQMDAVQQRYSDLQRRAEEREAAVARLHEHARKRVDELHRMEELCAARAKELSIVTIGRTRGEKRASTLQSELDDALHQLSALKETTTTKILTLSNQVERLQSELKSAQHHQESVLSESNEAIRRLTDELDRISQELVDEHHLRVACEAERDEIRFQNEEERTILAQCDTTMTALDDENKSLQESNDALRHNSERLGGAVQEQTGKIELQAEQIAHLKDINTTLRAELQRAEASRDTFEAKLSETTSRFNAVCDELDGTTTELQQKQRQHADSTAELQLAHVTLKRQSEDEIALLRSRCHSLERDLDDSTKQRLLAASEAERRLIQTVSDREVELLRDAATKRQDLMAALTKEFESDPRMVRHAELLRQHAELVASFEQYHATVLANKSALVRDERRARSELDALVEDFFAVFHAAAHTVPQHFDRLLQQSKANEAELQGKLLVVSAALETSTSELSAVRSDLEAFRSVPNMDFLVSTRVDVVKAVAELLIRGRLTRRRLRSLFALPSWKLLLKEQLIPDDFGQLLCDIVDDFQWAYDKHRDLVSGSFTAAERLNWGIQTNLPGSGDDGAGGVGSPLPTIAFPPRSVSLPQQQMLGDD